MLFRLDLRVSSDLTTDFAEILIERFPRENKRRSDLSQIIEIYFYY